MPVPAEHLDEIAATVAQLYRSAETSLVRLMAKHLGGDLDRDMQAPEWVSRKLSAVQDLRRGAQAVVAGLTAASEGAFRDAAAEAFRAGHASAAAELPKAWFPRSGIGQAAGQAVARAPGFAAIEALAAAVHRDVEAKSSRITRDVVDAYRSITVGAAARALVGAETRREASQAMWTSLTDKGITSFTDRSGRRWQLPSYVEMAARTVTQRAAVEGQMDRLSSLGVDLVVVSDHGQECKLCRPWEQQILRRDNGPTGRIEVEHGIRDGEVIEVHVKATLDEARRAGLQHPNCRHSISAYLPGVTKSPPRPTPDPEGDQARQRQRAIERKIRAAKVRVEGALDEPARKAAKQRVTAAQAEMRAHLAAHPTLKRLPYREQIGTGSTPPKGAPSNPAPPIGPATQPDLLGAPGDVVRSTRPATSVTATEVTPRSEVPGQLTIDDAIDTRPPAAIRDLSDDDLATELDRAAETGDDARLDEVLAEMDRRQAAEVAAAPEPPDPHAAEWAAFERLVADGVPDADAYAEAFGKNLDQVRRDDAIARLRADGYRGASLDELARAAYRDRLAEDYLAAEDATRGQLLSVEGRSKGIDPRELWRQNANYARKYASDELLEWWDEHGRITFDQYREMLVSGQGVSDGRTGGETWLR